MKNHLRAMAWLLVVTMLSGGLLSCGDTPSETTAAVTTDPAAVEESTETELKDAVPELDFGGETFTISTTNYFPDEMDVLELTGEITNDAIYNRNQRMEERFNVVIEDIEINNPNHTEHPAHLRSSILSNDGAFDMAGVFVYYAGSLVLENLFQNWSGIPYADLEMPWWIRNINDAFTVDGKLYTAVSDLCISSMQSTYVYLFNQKLASDYAIEDLYTVVDEGRWTLDYLYDLTSGIYQDVNGDGTAGPEDVYGYLSDLVTSLDGYYATSGQPILAVTDSGLEVQMNSERAMGIFEKVSRLMHESAGTFRIYHGKNGQTYDSKYPLFMENHGLVMPVRMTALFKELRDMEVDFGILPYPKYDEEQKQHYTYLLDNYSVLCIPNGDVNVEMVGALAEAMAADSQKYVMPVFYESALQGKYTRDQRSVEMLDLIMAGRTFDISILYSHALGDMPYFLRNAIMNGKTYASSYAASEQKYLTSAKQLYEKLKAMP